MALGYGETSYRPFEEDELDTLQGLIGPESAYAPEPIQMQTPAIEPMPSMMQPEPVAPEPVEVEPAPVAAPEPVQSTQPEPLDLSFPAAAAPPRGLVQSGYASEGIADPERQKLTALHQQLADQQMASIDSGVQAERGIAQSGIQRADKRVADANVQKNTAQMALAGKEAAKAKLQAEGEEWSKRKEDPGKAFEGREWAGVLMGIAAAAGTFAQAMGWQNGNPVLDQFNRAVERSIASQREQKRSRLQEIRDRLGDEKAAELLIRAQLNDAIATRTEAEMAKATNEDTLKRLAPIAENRRAESQKDLLAAYERLVPKEQQQFARPTPGPQGKSEQERLKDALELDKALEERGYTPDQRQSAMQALGMPVASGKSAPTQTREDAAAKSTDDQSKAVGAFKAIQQLGNEAGLKRNADGSFQVEDSFGSRLNLPELGESISGAVGGATPIKNAREVAKEGLGRLMSGGVIGADEGEAFKKMLGEAQSRRQIADVLNKIQVVVEPRLKPADLEREREKTKPPSREQAGFRPVNR